MNDAPPFDPQPSPGATATVWRARAAAWRHLLPVIALSLFAHALVLGSLPDIRPSPSAAHVPLHATLVLTTPATAKPAAVPVAPPRARPRPAAQPQAPLPPVPQPAVLPVPPAPTVTAPNVPVVAPLPAAVAAVATVAAAPAAPPAMAPAVASAVVASRQAEPAPVVPPGATSPPVAAPPASPPLPQVKPPAPVRLRYDVIATDTRNSPPTQTFGKGNVSWSVEAGRYRLDLVASVDLLFLSLDVLASHSEGLLDEHGLAPLRYTETPRRRPAVATNFNRDPANPHSGTITFSAVANSYPLVAAAQDRLSVIFQLAGLLRANPAFTAIGQQVPLYVAGVRGDAETWVFHVMGRETLQPDQKPLDTLRLQRVARSGSNDRTVDLWYALERGGYPAQIRYTETNGNRIDLVLSGTE